MASKETLTDVFSSEAFQVLSSLVEDGEIEPEKAEYGREKYTEIHTVLIESMANESQLLEEAQKLHGKLEIEKKGDHAPNRKAEQEHSHALEMLDDDVKQAEAEAALAQEREQLLQLEVTELQRQRNELQVKVDILTEDHRQELLPQIEELRKETLELEQEVFVEKDRILTAEQEAQDMEKLLIAIEGQKKSFHKEKDLEHRNLDKASQLPDKARRQTDIVLGAVTSLKNQIEAANLKIKEKEVALSNLNLQQRELQEEESRLHSALDKGANAIDTRGLQEHEIQRDIDAAVLEYQRYLGDRAHIDMRIKNQRTDIKLALEMLARLTKEKDLTLQRLKDMESTVKNASAQIPPLKNSVERMASEKHAMEAERKQYAASIEDLKRDEDICMSAYLKGEASGKEKAVLLQLTQEEVAMFEKEVEQLKIEENERNRMLQKLGSQRDHMTRLLSNNETKLKETSEKAQLKNLEIFDLKNIQKETTKRVRDFQQLYDLVKNQRNKFMNLIQGAGQATAEMKDKLKILGNELDILQTECAEKDKALSKIKSDHQASIHERDTLRGELNQFSSTFRDRQSNVDEQIARIDKHNTIVNQMEKQMLEMKRDYEHVVQARNYTGIMLIDRNDELCILYEKANVQEEVMKQGELELKRREDEIRVLDIECRDLQRSIEATRITMAHIPELDSEVALLQKELLEARRDSELLSMALESPENHSRWRKLGGKVPNPTELARKAQFIEEKLNNKKERLLEKELVLDEIGSLSDRLRKQAAIGSVGTLDLAKAVNAYQCKIKATTRKLMASVSELSMYQATAMKLKKEKEELEVLTQEATKRFEDGEAPTDDAEREWQNIQRTQDIISKLAKEKANVENILDRQGVIPAANIAQRPNAYIPEELGIPKPYGLHAPFKPSDVGSTMRHVRKPELRDIVL